MLSSLLPYLEALNVCSIPGCIVLFTQSDFTLPTHYPPNYALSYTVSHLIKLAVLAL